MRLVKVVWLESSFDDLMVYQGHPERVPPLVPVAVSMDQSLEVVYEPENKSRTGQWRA